MVDEIGRVAGQVVEGLRSSPALLALMLMNVVFVGAAIWFLRALSMAQASRFDLLLKVCAGGMK